MEILKKFATFLTLLVFAITGVPKNLIASDGDEESGSFDEDTNSVEETPEEVEDTEEGSGVGAGVWVAITGAILGLFGSGSAPDDIPPPPHMLIPSHKVVIWILMGPCFL